MQESQGLVQDKEKQLAQANSTLKDLQSEKTKLLDEEREKNLKIDNLENQIKELQKKIP